MRRRRMDLRWQLAKRGASTARAWFFYVNEAARAYAVEHGSGRVLGSMDWISRPTRLYVAALLADEETEMRKKTTRSNPAARKTPFTLVLQGNYGYGHGWEDLFVVTAEDVGSSRAARESIQRTLREYQENEGGRYRIVQRKAPKARTNPAPRLGGKVGKAAKVLADYRWHQRQK
jgi:hypothetical protein